MNPQIREFYYTLDLEVGADLITVRQSYLQLVKVWHPDRFGNDQKLQAVANEKLKKINFAYEAITTYLENVSSRKNSEAPKTEATPPKTAKPPTSSEIYDVGLKRYFARDYKSALHFFLQAAEMGNSNAQYAVGFINYEHTSRNVFTLHKQYRNDHEAFAWWKKAAEQGNANAQYMLGVFYQYGCCTSHNETEARKWLGRAASKGHWPAKDRLSKMGGLHKLFAIPRAIPLAKWVMEPPPSAPPPS